MTCHRYIYKLCWRNRLLLPILLLLALILMMGLSLHSADVQYLPDGKVRLKYSHRHALIPREHHMVHVRDTKSFLNLSKHNETPTPIVVSDLEEVVLENSNNEINIRIDNSEGPTKDAVKNDISGIFSKHREQQRAHVSEDKPVKQRQANHPKNNIPNKRARAKFRRTQNPAWNRKLFYDGTHPPEIFTNWRQQQEQQCDGKFYAYDYKFALIRGLVIDKQHCTSQRKGGEKINKVLNQDEKVEYYEYEMGCFQLPCTSRPAYYFNGDSNHQNNWMYSLETQNIKYEELNEVKQDFTIAIVRYEYANIYHTMTDWYNAFLVMQFFQKTQWETNILLVDTHPSGSLDPVWPALFNSTRRLSAYPKRTLFTNIVWNILGYNSLMMDHYSPEIPLVEEFRDFFLSSFNVKDNHKLDCDSLSILLIWRRDYVAHPRNPTGNISRKIKNEAALMMSVQKLFPNATVRGAQIDLFDMPKQLDLVINADILIGMHGAGLTHALFLPKHAGLIELVPNYWSAANDHFFAIATWRNLLYEKWVDESPLSEIPDEHYTKVPTAVLNILLKNVIKDMCNPNRNISMGHTNEGTHFS